MTVIIDKSKPAGTTAATTAFCAFKLELPTHEGYLWIDGNGKITAGNGTLDDPKPNAFSLVEIDDCPGSTPTCKKSCYVHGLKKYAPETHRLYEHNSEMIRHIIATETAHNWAAAMAQYISENCKGGFRWHVSGDVFNKTYARFIALVCALSPKVNHWIYTRSFGMEYDPVEPLLDVPNLTINISADTDNWHEAMVYAAKHNLRVCYLTTNGEVPPGLIDGDVIFPDYNLRGGTVEGQTWFSKLSPQQKSFVCPVDYHGKAENRRCGPCARCLVRVKSSNDLGA